MVFNVVPTAFEVGGRRRGERAVLRSGAVGNVLSAAPLSLPATRSFPLSLVCPPSLAVLQVALVAGILAYKCGAPFAYLTGGTIAAYTAFTFSITQVGS